MRLRLGLRMVMLIVVACALALAGARSEWGAEWGRYLLEATLHGLVAGGLCTVLSLLLLWFVTRSAPWLRHASRDPRAEPHIWVWAWHVTARWATHVYARWPALLKQAFWSCCAAICLVLVLDQASAGAWWEEGAPGEIGWPTDTLLAAGVAFVAYRVWTRFAPSAAKEALARLKRRWRESREWTELYAGCRSVSTWLLMASPAWFRILLAWLLAEVSVPFAHLVLIGFFHVGPETSPSVVVPRFLAVLIIWLLACLAILVRGLYEMSHAFLPRAAAMLAGFTLSSVHVWAFFGIARSL